MTAPNRQAERTERSTEAYGRGGRADRRGRAELDDLQRPRRAGRLQPRAGDGASARSAGWSTPSSTAYGGACATDVLPLAQRPRARRDPRARRRHPRAGCDRAPRHAGDVRPHVRGARARRGLRGRMVEFTTSMRADLAAALRRGVADGSVRRHRPRPRNPCSSHRPCRALPTSGCCSPTPSTSTASTPPSATCCETTWRPPEPITARRGRGSSAAGDVGEEVGLGREVHGEVDLPHAVVSEVHVARSGLDPGFTG